MSRTRRDIETLADLLMGTDAPMASAQSDRIVLMVEGHLPVRSVLWRLAAAKLVGEDQCATLLEIDDLEVSVTALGGPSEHQTCGTLEHVVSVPAVGHLWFVAGAGHQVGLPMGVREVVLLTGADQAAVVGAYQVVKDLVRAAGGQLIEIGVVIAGSAPCQAEDAFERLQSTIRDHLGLEARLAGVLPKLDADQPIPATRVPLPEGSASLVFEAIRARPTPAMDVTPPTSVITEDAHPEQMEDAGSESAFLGETTDEDLSPLIPEGLQPLAMDTTAARNAQMLINAEGGLHVVVQDDAAALEAGRTWATRHLTLLASADAAIDITQGVTCVFVTIDVHLATSLAGGAWEVFLRHENRLIPIPPPPESS